MTHRYLPLKEALLASGLALCAGSSAVAQPMVGGPGPMPPHAPGAALLHPGPPGPLHDLDLSEVQRDQVFRIFHAQAPEVHERMKTARRAREALENLSAAPSFDQQRARAFADVEAKALADISLMRAEAMSRIREILTPDQRARLDERRTRSRSGPR